MDVTTLLYFQGAAMDYMKELDWTFTEGNFLYKSSVM